MFESLLSFAGPLVGGLMQGDAAENAASSQEASTREAINEQRRQYDLNREDLRPYRDVGGAAVNRLGDLLGLDRGGGRQGDYVGNGRQGNFDDLLKQYDQAHIRDHGMTLQDSVDQGFTSSADYGRIIENLKAQSQGISGEPERPSDFGALNKKFTLADFWDDPVTKASYEFGLNEGTKALDRMGGARGSRNSGAQLKALTKFGTDYTGTKAGESYGRFYGDQDRDFNRLAGVAGTGQTAANASVASGTNTANTIGNLVTSQGNARGAAQIAGGNAVGGAANNIGNWWNQQQIVNRLTGGRPSNFSNAFTGWTAAGGDQYG